MRSTIVTNTSELTDHELVVLFLTTDKLGTFRNFWRQRDVGIYPHPVNRFEVITVGVGFGEALYSITICNEPLSTYDRQLVQGDWSPYR